MNREMGAPRQCVFSLLHNLQSLTLLSVVQTQTFQQYFWSFNLSEFTFADLMRAECPSGKLGQFSELPAQLCPARIPQKGKLSEKGENPQSMSRYGFENMRLLQHRCLWTVTERFSTQSLPVFQVCG